MLYAQAFLWQNYTSLALRWRRYNQCGNDDKHMTQTALSQSDLQDLADKVKVWGRELGFQQIGITHIELGEHETRLKEWLAKGYHGNMEYMAAHDNMRSRPADLLPGTLRVISARMDYLPADARIKEQLQNKSLAYVSRYALGRDYHKVIRKRLTQLGKMIEEEIGHGYRAFVDSAPVLERALASNAGLGWLGKNTMLINKKAGSYFFLGELLTDLPLPIDQPDDKNHCGSCTACIDICPTQAFVGEQVLDARRCISYLTIELKGPIPTDLRKGMGNRIFGCDDCQLCCPWNRFSKTTQETDFTPRHPLDNATLLELFAWDQATFLKHTEGNPIRRTGYENWLRNIAVALGNAPTSIEITEALKQRLPEASELVTEHIEWALIQHKN
ncbi:MAG: epoxyqueuosine reductase [Oleispira sp.]|jgi:epoxyqueuosine reductase